MTWPQRWPDLKTLCTAVGSTPGQTLFVAENRLPIEDAHLPLFAKALAGSLEQLPPSHTLVWVQPLGPTLSLTGDEAEQILGATGAIKLLEQDLLTDGRPCYVAAAVPRPKILGFCLRWRLADIEHQQDVIIRALDRVEFARFVHIIEVPGDEKSEVMWQTTVKGLIRKLACRSKGNCVLGAFIPELTDNCDCFSRNVQFVNELACNMKLKQGVECQWVGRMTSVREARLAHAFARDNRIGFDLSLSHSLRESVRPYLQDGAYFPLDIDPRAPSGLGCGSGVVELPRIEADTDGPLTGWAEFKRARTMFEAHENRIRDRLDVALDRGKRAAYLKQLEADSTRVREWNIYQVYNWAPPPNKLIRILAVEASTLPLRSQMPSWVRKISNTLTLSRSHIVLCNARELLKAAREQAMARTADRAGYLGVQITGHAYLEEGRKEVTGDGKALIAELPELLGTTLEIGCGYGLTAALVAERAARYVGLDLSAAPVAIFARKGVEGVVGDIHGLPFRSGRFDTAIADNVIEHSYDPESALKEIHRVLKPGGRVYAVLPLDGNTSEYRIKMHMWKADLEAVRVAFGEARYEIEMLRTLRYADLGIYGCFPASSGETCLIIARKRDDACAA